MSTYNIDDEMTNPLPQQHPQQFQQQRNTPSVGDLMTELIRLQQQLVKQQLTGSVADDGRKKKLPDPERFDGEDRAKYPTFETYLLAKLDVDRLVIGNEQTQVFYAFGRLTGRAAEQMRDHGSRLMLTAHRLRLPLLSNRCEHPFLILS